MAMRAPIAQLSKPQLIMLGTKKCKHGHTYLEHYGCYRNEMEDPEKVGFLDIESSDLKANFGIMLSYCIKDAKSDKIWFDVITKKDLAGDLDKRLVKHCIEDMRKFDRLVGHYSTKFDIPFIRTRAITHGLDFPVVGEINHTDVWYMARRLLCLNSNRQGTVAEAIQNQDIKTRITPHYWIRALQGQQEALDYILDHNKKDVVQLEGNYNKLQAYSRNNKKSI
jgi:uncharacterized protein YprB with RNaseH-like and TPR domain